MKFNSYSNTIQITNHETEKNKSFESELFKLLTPIKSRLKLILHVGTPKTGTTSLQVYLNKKQRKLCKLGILYPNRSHNSDAPKHQWFEKNLVRTHTQNLLNNFKEVLSDIDENTHTILLSSEGIYNSWWDFPEESKLLLQELNKHFEVNIWVWFREPVTFAESFYKQCMRNPVVASIPCYGRDLSFNEILEDDWFRQHLDYMGFVNEAESLFGQDSVTVFEYQKDTVSIVSKLLGLATPHDNPTSRKNASMNATTAELYRVVNRLKLSAKEKEKLVPHLQDLSSAIDPYESRNNQYLVDDESRKTIERITAKGMKEIQGRYFKD